MRVRHLLLGEVTVQLFWKKYLVIQFDLLSKAIQHLIYYLIPNKMIQASANPDKKKWHYRGAIHGY